MKRFIAIIISVLLVFQLAACGGHEGTTEAESTEPVTTTAEAPETTPAPTEPTEPPEDLDVSAAENWQYDISGYFEESKKIYDEIFGEYLKYYGMAREKVKSEDLSERWVLEAIAEAKLLNAGVMLPTATLGGGYVIGRAVPKTAPTVLWGNDSSRLHSLMVVNNDFLTRADSDAICAKWAELKGTGTFAEWAEDYLTEQGYILQDTYTVSYAEDPQTWDPMNTYRSADIDAIVMTLDGLMEYDIENVQQPALAVSVEANANNTVFTFKLREGVMWSTSSGEEYAEVTADDFVAGLQHLLDAGAGLEGLAGDDGVKIKGATAYLRGEVTDFKKVGVMAVDPHTVRYTLEESCPWFGTLLGSTLFFPLNRAYYESQGGKFGAAFDPADPEYLYGKDPEHIVYCGPYLVGSLTEKDSIVFRENPNYWNKDNVRLKTVTWRFRDSSDELKDYGMTKAGELDSCSLSTAAAVAEAVTDGLFDKYACPAGTDAPSCMAFFNVMRNRYANLNDPAVGVSAKTVRQARVYNAFMQNIHFRHALVTAVDRGSYNAVTEGEELKLDNLRNGYVPGSFVQLTKDVTVVIDGKSVTFPAGTYYGEIVQAQLDADGFKITVWDPKAQGGLGSGDGFDGWYDPDYAFNEFRIALDEMKAQGVEVSSDDPIVIEIPYAGNSPLHEGRANVLKQSIEKALRGYVKVVLNDCGDSRGWRNAGYYPEFGYDMNTDFMDAFARSPYYGDPAAYLSAMLPVPGGMVRACGIY